MRNRTAKIRNYIYLFGVFFIYSSAGILAKVAANQETMMKMLIFLGLEFVVLGIYALMWQQILKRFQLTIAIASKGITVIYAIGWSTFLFKESISVWNIVGAILVMIGIWVVSSDG